MNCWSILGLDAPSDIRSIKRRYAVLLKQNRPDEDPAGFQRLRDAYEQALSWA
ncbi:J domain-containing protein, partial [Pseudomonas amygdali]